jgi:hypothetical protein
MTRSKRETEVVSRLEDELMELNAQRAELDQKIKQLTTALGVMNGEMPAPRRSSPTARRSLVAALASFDTPVNTSRLLDHDLLVHYSRHTLRSALTDLHRAGEISGERAPKGFIWDPRSASTNGTGP